MKDRRRALYERNKGRDLFDLWLAITELGLRPTSAGGAVASRVQRFRARVGLPRKG